MPVLIVMTGGALGAGARHLVNRATLAWFGPGFPWGTLAVNLFGSMCMGLIVGALVRFGGSDTLRLFLTTGVLGGFTTFSAFSLEMVTIAERGQLTLALGYAALSVGGGAAALVLGLAIARSAA